MRAWPCKARSPSAKVDLPFDEAIPNHWLDGSPVATHFFNGLNLVFPDGERFFIRAVQDHLDRIDDEGLRARIKGFFGQEGWHAHEHERYFAVLEEQGYRISIFLRRFHRFIALSNRFMPAALRLSITAGAEHYTATLGANALDNPLLEKAHPVMRSLIYWHAAEELEHKSVAFDVLRQTHPSYALRIFGFAVATLCLAVWTFAGMRMLLREDGIDRHAARAEALRLRRVTRAKMERAIGRGIREYLRRDFHPDQKDDSALAARGLAAIGDLATA
jgi:predicted metal-dependent hydrolase